MANVKMGLVGAAYTHRSVAIDGQELVNLYPEVQDPSSKAVSALIGTPGLELYITVTSGTGPCRGMYVTGKGRWFGVWGTSVVEIARGAAIEIGTIGTIIGRVGMVDNGNQLIVADGRNGYIYDLSTWSDAQTGQYHNAGTWAQIIAGEVTLNITGTADPVIVDSEFPGGPSVVFKDGFFVAQRPNTGQFAVSRSYDGNVWDASFYATAEGSPDNLVTILKTNNELWLFGSGTTEVWFTTGDATFPFQRINGAWFDVGTDAISSPASNNNILFWLGSNDVGHGSIWMASGYMPTRISTHAIEYQISLLPRIDDAIGWCYQEEGHQFYVLTFPSGDKTFVYDISTQMWHERSSYNIVPHAWRARYHALVDGVNYVGDDTDGKIYKMNLNLYTENGNPIRRVRTFPHTHAQRKRMFFREFEIDMEKGVGLQAN